VWICGIGGEGAGAYARGAEFACEVGEGLFAACDERDCVAFAAEAAGDGCTESGPRRRG
jgi:hypothetical protein